MEAANPVCRWLVAASVVALAGCQSGGTSAAVSARGQSPPELPAPLSPASSTPIIPPQPIAPVGPVTPIQPVPSSNGPVVQGLPVGSGNAGTPVQGVPAGSGPVGTPIQGLPVASGNAPVQGFPVNSGPITPVAMVSPESNRMTVGKAAHPQHDVSSTITNGVPQVKVIALVGSSNLITDQEVIEAVHMRSEEYLHLQGAQRTNKEKAIYREELLKLIERELILDDMFARLKKNKASTEDIKEIASQNADDSLRRFRNMQNARTEEEFIVLLRGQGLTIGVLHRKIEREIMSDEYLRSLTKETGRNVGFAEIRAYYEQHPEQFQTADRVVWQDVFISFNKFQDAKAAYAHAENVRQLAVAGTDFVSLVKAQETNPLGRQNWDGIGTTRQTVPVDVAPTVWALQPGQISGIIETPSGYHVIKVLEREYAGVRPLDVKTQIECRDKVSKMYRETERKKLIEDLWRKGSVEVFETN